MIRLYLTYLLFSILVAYNSHRYLFKLGSSDFINASTQDHNGYIPIPIGWQVGKYVLVSLLLVGIFSLSRFRRPGHLQILYGFFLVFIVSIVVLSGRLYGVVVNCNTSELQSMPLLVNEIEYVIFCLIFFPVGMLSKRDQSQLQDAFHRCLPFATYFLFFGNVVAVFNYLAFGRLPFHAYEGALIARFGSFWDDPNGIAILSSIFLFVNLRDRKWILASLQCMNIAVSFSLTGFLLLGAVLACYSLRKPKTLLCLMLAGCLFAVTPFLFPVYVSDFIAEKAESISSHTSTYFQVTFVPLQQPLLLHESWLLSFLFNYSPLSILAIGYFLYKYVSIWLSRHFTEAMMTFFVFFTASIALPFLSIFPLNAFFGFYFPILLLGNTIDQDEEQGQC